MPDQLPVLQEVDKGVPEALLEDVGTALTADHLDCDDLLAGSARLPPASAGMPVPVTG